MLSDPCPASFREAKPPRSTAALLVLASVLFVAFAPAAGAAEDRDEIVLDGLFAARFASLEEASRRLGGRDPFVRAMGALDRRVRLGTDRDVDEEEYLRFARSAAREWGEDRERVAGALRSIAPALRKLELPWPATVTFVATSGDEEGGAAYCRDGAVFLPQPMIERVGDGLPRLIAHELFHILSSSRKDLRRAVYRALGATEARLELPKDMAARRITNPDAAGIDAVWRVEVDGEPGETLDVHAAPILLHRSTDDSKGAPFFRQLSLEFVAVEQASERTAPRTDEEAAVESALPLFRPKLREGEPWLIPLRENASFWRSIGRNTSYIIHPEEVAADNFAHLVLSAKDLRSPEILERLRHALASRPEAAVAEMRAARRQGADALLDALARRAAMYFLDHQDPTTGLVLDRASNRTTIEERRVASIAATGFGLAAWVIAAERGWIPRDEAQERCRRVLRYATRELEHDHGFFWHFMDARSGERVWGCEISTIDTTLFLLGALFAGESFSGTEVETLAESLLARADWEWFRTDGGRIAESRTVSMGFTPEAGFIRARWDHYSELLGLYVLALGSPSHAVPADCWTAWEHRSIEHEGETVIGGALPYFVHQYSHVFIDFRGRDDRGIDWHENSRKATRHQRDTARRLAGRFRTFEDFWGISASDGPRGYRAYAPVEEGLDAPDGTVSPAVALAGVIFDAEGALRDLERWVDHEVFERVFGVYGFTDAFNLAEDWVGPDVIGITVGSLLLAIENHRTGLVWRRMEEVDAIRKGLERAGLDKRKARD